MSKIMVIIDLSTFFSDTAKLNEIEDYENQALAQAEEGYEITLTGAAPVWLYLRIAHVLHGKAKKLFYSSPVTGEVSIFDHNPF